MSTHANMVKMTVTSVASAGVGTITLNAASSGYRTFGTAYGADATVDILITEGTTWEVARNCTYTHTGTTVTRGTLESSSTGSAVTFTSAAVVSVVATADSGRRWDSASLQSVAASVTTADVTGVVGQLHELDISGLTAARSFVLPAVAAVNDRVGVRITAGYTGAGYSYGLILKADTGDTLQGVSAAEWSRLIITGEIVIMRCTVANTTWMVDVDGRIAQNVAILGAHTHTSSGAWQTASFSGATTLSNVGSGLDVSGSKIYVRRAGLYNLETNSNLNAATADKIIISGMQLNGADGSQWARGVSNAIAGGLHVSNSRPTSLAAGNYVDVQLWQNDSASESVAFLPSVSEKL